MNIFMTHPSPMQSARWLDDVRVNKMLTESCQLLSTAIRICSGDDPSLCKGIYKTTHKNVGCAIWARAGRDNYVWLITHAQELHRLYNQKNNRIHASLAVLERLIPLNYIIPEGATQPYNSAKNSTLGIDFTDEENVFVAYRKYLVARWNTGSREPTWHGREKPFWIETYENITTDL